MTLYHHLTDNGHRVSVASVMTTMTLFRQMTEYRHLRYQIPAETAVHLHRNHGKINDLSQPGEIMMRYGKVVAIDFYCIRQIFDANIL
jgi:hypothetical protein